MKNLKRLYFIPSFLAILVTIALIVFLFPKAIWVKAGIVCIIPMLILIIGFRWITQHRMQIIRKQLYQILRTLESFDVDEPEKVNFEPSPFPLFNELNEYLIELIDRIRENYHANKQFTQNASHELQTPLAIIKGNVEILLQSPNIGEKEIQSLANVLQNTNRLSKLNSTLILLSKIEHQRFQDTELVDFAKLTEEVLNNFEDMIEIRAIKVFKNYQAPFTFSMSETLAEVLIANLVQNAIRHNNDEGEINIHIDSNQFRISNSGVAPKVKTKLLFKRFRRESSDESSLGLGLSIVKRICEQSGLNILYDYDEGIHQLSIEKLL